MTTDNERVWHILLRVLKQVSPTLSSVEQEALSSYLPSLKDRINEIPPDVARRVIKEILTEIAKKEG